MTKKGSPGLTLMELVLTMSVLAILLVIAWPVIGQFSSGYRLRAAARKVAKDLQFARLLAVKENKDSQCLSPAVPKNHKGQRRVRGQEQGFQLRFPRRHPNELIRCL